MGVRWRLAAGPITFGTVLSATQLNATAPVPGTFVYTPPAGTVLRAGTQTLAATFTPTDSANFTTATAKVPLTVNKATPAIALTSSANPVQPSDSITLIGTVGSPTAVPTGTLVFTERNR